jgi:hypothetical protein
MVSTLGLRLTQAAAQRASWRGSVPNSFAADLAVRPVPTAQY